MNPSEVQLTSRRSCFSSKPARARSGVALVIVLCMLLLITVLVVGFFTSVTNDRSRAQSYVNATNTRQLAEAAVNLVMGQIVLGASSSQTSTWTSQPGLIRTFDNTGGLGNFYKLYSSNSMIVPGGSFSAAAEAPSTSWNTQPAFYTDLNSPVLVSDTTGNIVDSSGNTYTANFPIVDGNNLVDGSKFNPPVPAYPPVAGAKYLTYSGTSANTPGVVGFYVQSPPTYNGQPTQISGTNNPVPMPVQWLYVLQNGTVLAPTGSGKVAIFSTASTQPTQNNPIVGRIAFWTDDETCKLNINTAAGDVPVQYPVSANNGISFGSFWDIPRADNADERGANTANGTFLPGLAWSQPVVNEFQRYPGHPATVALNTVFPTFSRQDIDNVIPRIQGPGSQGGSVQTTLTQNATAIVQDADRLYTSVDELMFKPTLSGSNRQQNQPIGITRNKLDQSKFFLTASSRAPDLNLFGQPRVCIWPISSQMGSSGTAYGTAYDRLIAFCTTTGTLPYYFQRTASMVSTGGSSDYNTIPRNQQLYSYLENMTGQAIPGFANTSGGLLAKYGTNRDQILTEIFDYIRCVNLADLSVSTPFTAPLSQNLPSNASGLVAPIEFTSPKGVNTKGFGRFPTLMESALQFYVDTATSSAATSGTYVPVTMKAVFIPKLFNPMHGYYPPMESIDETATFSTGSNDWIVTLNGTNPGKQSLSFPTMTTTNSLLQGGIEWGSRPWGGEQFFGEQFQANSSPTGFKTLAWSGLDSYPFCSNPGLPGVNISGTSATAFNFSGGTVTFTLAYHGQRPVQTFTLYFPPSAPSAPWPLPIVSASNQGQYQGSYSAGGAYNQRITGLLTGNNNPPPPPIHPNAIDLIDPGDMVKALEPVGLNFPPYPQGTSSNPQAPFGDLRLVALAITDTSSFQPHYNYLNYKNGTPIMAHSLRFGGNGGVSPVNYYPGCYMGQLVGPTTGNVNNPTLFGPYDAPAITGGILDITAGGKFVGDFDNGIGYWPDGPYANKPDEGDIFGQTNNSIYQPYFQNAPNSSQNTQAFSPQYFSPNRQMSSAVMFGSLPSRVFQSGGVPPQPWETLLFHPDPTGQRRDATPPKDHLLLDLFTMPVVEPYAISEPFSTAGRINLNCQIMPFGTSIVRETGLLSLFESTWMMAISAADIKNASYKGVTSGSPRNYRFPIDGNATLQEFESRFNNPSDANYNRNFVSASEICDIDLLPGSLTNGLTSLPVTSGSAALEQALVAYWGTGTPTSTTANTLTGANTRDMPYNHIYPLLTTKSNTFTVHMRAQTLKQVPAGRTTPAAWATWAEGTDQVTGEYRGSTTIERYIDPTDSRFLSTSGTNSINPDTQSLEFAYKFRVLNVKQFEP